MKAEPATPFPDPRRELSRIYRETLGADPSRVDTFLGQGLVVAVLYDVTTPAEQDLCRRQDGCRLFLEYLSACADGMVPAIQELAYRQGWGQVRAVHLQAVSDTPHKLLLVVCDQRSLPHGKEE